MADQSSLMCVPDAVEPLSIPAGKSLTVRITPLTGVQSYPGRVCGVACAQACSMKPADQIEQYLCLDAGRRTSSASCPSQTDLIALESLLRQAALSVDGRMLLELNATPVVDCGSDCFLPLTPPAAGGFDAMDAFGLLRGAGAYQLATFPIARFNGIGLPADASIRFADPSRWLQPGAMESRLLTITTNGKQYYSWDAHAPVGKTPHDYFHVNQKGTYALFKDSDHAALAGARLVQARQLRYLKIGGRVFLIVGIVVDTVQMGAAAVESYQQKSVKPVVAQAVRVAGGWGAAWAGAKAGVAIGGLAGVETGPGLVLVAIGGGLIGGAAGYFGADWIADWIHED